VNSGAPDGKAVSAPLLKTNRTPSYMKIVKDTNIRKSIEITNKT